MRTNNLPNTESTSYLLVFLILICACKAWYDILSIQWIRKADSVDEREDLTYKNLLGSGKICCVAKEMINALPCQYVPI